MAVVRLPFIVRTRRNIAEACDEVEFSCGHRRRVDSADITRGISVVTCAEAACQRRVSQIDHYAGYRLGLLHAAQYLSDRDEGVFAVEIVSRMLEESVPSLQRLCRAENIRLRPEIWADVRRDREGRH